MIAARGSLLRAVSIALMSGLVLLPVSSPLQAQAVSAPTLGGAVPQTVGRVVTLPTGDRVRLGVGPGGKGYAVQPAETRGIGSVLTIEQTKTGTYVVPAYAKPYLGRFLDRELFNVTRLDAELGDQGRLPVRISYQGGTPNVPGVTLTTASAGAATGYLDAESAHALGHALMAQWRSDQRAGWPRRAVILGGVTTLVSGLRASVSVTPKYQMNTLAIRVVGSDGKPEPAGSVILMNVDNFDKFTAEAVVADGEARVSVPAGHYSLIGQELSENAAGGSDVRVVTVNEYDVTKTGQALTLDYRTATGLQSLRTPKPADVVNHVFWWKRFDAQQVENFDLGFAGFSNDDRIYTAPATTPSVGKLNVVQTWQMNGPGETPSYTYDLATSARRIRTDPVTTFAASSLATVKASYYDDAATSVLGDVSRAVAFPKDSRVGGIWWDQPVPRGTSRTEYVGSLGADAQWSSSGYLKYSPEDGEDHTEFVQPWARIAAGTSHRSAWFQGPLGPGIPRQSTVDEDRICFACRTPTMLHLELAAVVDAAGHYTDPGSFTIDPDGAPVTRFRFYTNGKLVESKDNYLGDSVPVTAAKATYKVALDVDRRLQAAHQSTSSHTELTFRSGGSDGTELPTGWNCALTGTCRVLPVVQARVNLPIGLDGTLPAGRSSVTVTVSGIQNSAASSADAATVKIRPSGGSWQSVTMTAIGHNRYRGTIDNSGLAGRTVDLRVEAGNSAGSTYSQTVLRAYTVAGSVSPASSTSVAPKAATVTTAAVEHVACPAAAKGMMRCLSRWHARPRLFGTSTVSAPTAGITPPDIRAAYKLPNTGGTGQTIAIVDAYDDPMAEADLKAYRAAWKLPACTTANKCFTKVDQRGTKTYPAGDPGWGIEISLDVQAVSAACPNCNIMLVEADDAQDDSLGAAVNTAVRLGATIVSNSYGAEESKDSLAQGARYFRHPGVPLVVAAGDDGFTIGSFPAVLPNVWAVGGTFLKANSGGGWSETAWELAGSGCSAWYGKPKFQKDKHCPMRTISDVSAIADSDGGYAVYDTYGLGDSSGWIGISGTSVSAPLIAGMIGLAGNPAAAAQPSYAYAHRSGLADIKGGSNGYCGGDYLCTGVKGYDGPTGLGSPRGLKSL